MKSRPQPDATVDVAPTKSRQHEIAMQAKGRGFVPINSEIFKGVYVALDAKLGQAELSVEELLGLGAGSVVKLDLKMNDLIELRLNDSLVARGEIVAVGDNFGVRVVEIAEIS